MTTWASPAKLRTEGRGWPAEGMSRARTEPRRRRIYFWVRIAGWALGGAVGALVLSLPAPQTLSALGLPTLAATAAAMVWWVVDVGAGAASLIYTGVLLATGNPASLALAGWREPAFWFFGALLFYGVTMTSIGLDRRIAHAVLSVVRPSYGGLLTALAIIGFVLALLIPPLRIRMAVLASISLSVTQALGRPRGSRETLLLGLGTWVAAVVPGLAVPAVGLGAGLARNAVAPTPLGGLTWLGWLVLLGGPAVLLTGIALGAVYLVVRPRQPPALTRTYFRHYQLRLGKPVWRERVALAVFLASLVAWITKEWHGVPESTVALVGVAALVGTGALPLRQLVQWRLWSTLVFFATLFAIPELLAQEGITDWLGGYLTPIAHVGTESLVVAGIVLISARSSSSWAPIKGMAPSPRADPVPRRRGRGRVALDLRGPHPTFLYVHEVSGGPSRGGGRRLWAARANRSPLIGGKPARRWGQGGWVPVSGGREASTGGRSLRGPRGGPWSRL